MFKSSTNFDKLLDKATSLTNLEPDWTSILQLCDSIRQNDVQPKYALSAIKKKLSATNPNVVLMTFQVLESCVKNCGSVFHNEVTSKQFMEDIHEILKTSTDSKVKEEILRIIQAWAHAFRNEPSFRAVQDQMRIMKAEGYKFPVFKESDAMFSASNAPEWTDGECCHRCRVQFTMVVRKHHCRHCGQVFCAKCSSKTSTIPKFGIEKEVRVCDVCFDKINKKPDLKLPTADESKSKTTVSKKTEQEIQEEEDLLLALALSKSEAENKELNKLRYSQLKHTNSNYSTPTNNSSSSNSKHKSSKTSKTSKSSKKTQKIEQHNENEDPEIARYLNREYWQQKVGNFEEYENSPSPSAPQSTTITKSSVETSQTKVLKEKSQNKSELESFIEELNSSIEIFLNRLNSNKLRGRAIANDSGVHSMFLNLTGPVHSQLAMYMHQTSEARTNCERLQDKINQIRDARAALDALREDYREQMRRAAEDAERIRQQQMAQKLEIMRQKKHEYLQYQREIALQRMQEQERELLMRTEQFKFASSGSNVPVVSQWAANNPANYVNMPQPSHNYYMSNPNFPASLASQQAMMNAQVVINGQYVQAPLPNTSNMVTSSNPPMTTPAVANLPAQMPMQSISHPVMPGQYMPQIASSNMYMPAANSYPQEAVPQMQYQIQPPVVQSQLPPQTTNVPEEPAHEELLIKFD